MQLPESLRLACWARAPQACLLSCQSAVNLVFCFVHEVFVQSPSWCWHEQLIPGAIASSNSTSGATARCCRRLLKLGLWRVVPVPSDAHFCHFELSQPPLFFIELEIL